MEKQKKLIELVFYAVVFIALVAFLIFKGIHPKETSVPEAYEPPLIGIPAPIQVKPVQTDDPNQDDLNGDEATNSQTPSAKPLLPQNIPYWELD